MSDIWARVDEAIDTDPLQLRDIVAELLARAEKAEHELALLTRAAKTVTGNDWYGRIARSEAAVERVREAHASCLFCLMGLSCRIADALDAPHSPADARTPVSAATEAHGEAGEAQEARE